MQYKKYSRPYNYAHGFTLVEILVTIVILAVLATIIFGAIGKVRQKAQAASSLSNVRQAGIILLAHADDSNGRLRLFYGGAGNYDSRSYNIIRAAENIDYYKEMPAMEIMHWNVKKLPPALNHWNCRGINFTTIRYRDGREDGWVQSRSNDSQEREGVMRQIIISTLNHPETYPLLMDSSQANGNEIFRIDENLGDLPGLRNDGKCAAFRFDGSAALLDKEGLRRAGFKRAYDNSSMPPTVISF